MAGGLWAGLVAGTDFSNTSAACHAGGFCGQVRILPVPESAPFCEKSGARHSLTQRPAAWPGALFPLQSWWLSPPCQVLALSRSQSLVPQAQPSHGRDDSDSGLRLRLRISCVARRGGIVCLASDDLSCGGSADQRAAASDAQRDPRIRNSESVAIPSPGPHCQAVRPQASRPPSSEVSLPRIHMMP